ncbi:MAG: acyl-CoA dehydrogenase family protein [Planctomycetota bacterium]
MHNFELTEEQQMVLETVGKFVQDVAEPKALEHDEHGRFVRPQFDQLAELGMLGLPVAEDAGGAGMGFVATVVALETVAGACGSTARLLAVQAGVCASALSGLAPGAELLGELASGSRLASWIGPESGVQATGTGDSVKLQGKAPLVTAATEADVFVVAAMADGEAVLATVPRAAVRTAAVPALGLRAAAPGCVEMAAADATVVARGADAEAAWARARVAAAVATAAIACGLNAASLRLTTRHAGERIAFGKPLAAQPAVAHKLVEMRRRLHAARHATYHAARLLDAGVDATEAAWLAKIEAIEGAVLAADEGIQIHGGYGYVVEYHVERHYRDAKTLEVLEDGLETLRDRLVAPA